ncbi:MAG: ABC transporter permease [Candidatus Aenigmarchaeota archaeon]|nr:ABC transporter permease [Candidatus Aenigmarchaeota archaeon]
MRFEDTFKLALNSLLHRKLRSWLTILGIIIGVASVIALISISEGFSASILQQLSVFGSGTIIVTPGHSSAIAAAPGGGRIGTAASISGTLTSNDVNALKSIEGISFIDGILSESIQINYRGQEATTSVQGVDAEIWKQIQNVPLQSGRYLVGSDVTNAVIGDSIANKLFKYNVELNSIITINGEQFRVVGIFKRAGSQLGLQDNTIIIPKDTARKLFTDIPENQFSSILIKVSDTANQEQVSNDIQQRLFTLHHVNENTQDFSIISSDIIKQQVDSITQSFTIFTAGIAGISLLVGGIGIANTMFMSVMERTRQIGILKSLGSTNYDVLRMFLTESALMGFVGGAIGVVLGALLSFGFSQISLQPDAGAYAGEAVSIPFVLRPEIVVFALLFSIGVGSISGLFPAKKAAELQPVEALRYE